MQIVLDETQKDFVENFLAFTYEDICKNIFINLCTEGEISFVPSCIGSYWKNDSKEDTEIGILSIDNQNKRIFAGECKYHIKPVDATVYFALKEKIESCQEIHKVYPEYSIVFGLFSRSGFTKRMLDLAKNNQSIFLINETELMKI